MKKFLRTIALISTLALLLSIAIFAILIVVFLIQGNFGEAAHSFYNLVIVLLTLVLVSVFSDKHSN